MIKILKKFWWVPLLVLIAVLLRKNSGQIGIVPEEMAIKAFPTSSGRMIERESLVSVPEASGTTPEAKRVEEDITEGLSLRGLSMEDLSIYIPAVTTSVTRTSTSEVLEEDTSEPTPTPSSNVHLVAPGEGLWSISRQYSWVEPRELAEFNGLDPEAMLYVGQKLRLPPQDQ